AKDYKIYKVYKDAGISAIETSSAICNVASFGLMEKLGFIKRSEETHKQKYTFLEEPIECYSYWITSKEYLSVSNKTI
ncbi:MAG: hypothetical protein WCT23_09775, partial [Candidatus Neomarinimicrobiota bacterium]